MKSIMKYLSLVMLLSLWSYSWAKKPPTCTSILKENCKHNMGYECFRLNIHKFPVNCQNSFELNASLKGNEEGCRSRYDQLCRQNNGRMKFEQCLQRYQKAFSGLCLRALIAERNGHKKMAKDCNIVFTKLCPFKPKRGDKIDLEKIGSNYVNCIAKNKKKIPKDCKKSLDGVMEGYTPIR